MPNIPSAINGVTVEFQSTVGKNVVQRLIDGMQHCIKKDIASGYTVSKIYVSSAKDSHSSPSRHVIGKAVDISRINGKKMSESYPNDALVKAVTDAIQVMFESFKGRRENFGPHFKKKLGAKHKIAGHADHIHLSVN
jgi:hypothetical protein